MFSVESILKYPSVFLTGAIVALLLTRAWGPHAPRFGFVDRPEGRKRHHEPVPTAGGIAVFLGFHAACALVFLFPWKPFAGQLGIDWWLRFLPLSTAVVALGLADDRFNLRPVFKLSGQTLIALAAYLLGMRVQNVLGVPLPAFLDFGLTLLWFLALMNAFNLIDGIDGLAAGIALIAAAGIALSLVFRHAPGDVLLFLGFCGACAGFLRYNFYPARVFLGDTGSLFLGFSLAMLAISTHSKGTAMAAIGVPLLAVGIPLFDTLLAVWRRSVRSVLAGGEHGGALHGVERGDAEHLHHRLLRGGRRHSHVALLLYAGTAALVAIGLLASLFRDRALGILALAFLVGAYIVVRHLVWIELRDTGEAFLKGVSQPIRRNRTMLFYLVFDVLALHVAWLASVTLLDLQDGSLDLSLKSHWLRSAPLDVVVPFLMLAASRSYSRVWSLARVTEYGTTALAVVFGVALAFGVRMVAVTTGGEGAWPVLLHYVVMGGLALPAIIGARAALRVVQDLMNIGGWHARDGLAEQVIVWGAGHRSTLFLRQHASHASPRPRRHVRAMFDPDPALRGHLVHGIRVMGGADDVLPYVRRHSVSALYLLDDWPADAREGLEDLHRETGLRICRWQITEEALHG